MKFGTRIATLLRLKDNTRRLYYSGVTKILNPSLYTRAECLHHKRWISDKTNLKEEVDLNSISSEQSSTSSSSSSTTANVNSSFRGAPLPGMQPNSSIAGILYSNLKQAWQEMTGTGKDSALKRVVTHAQVYKQNRDDFDEEEEVYDGTRQMVLVKDPLSAWEHMKSRLQESPLIQSILRSSGKVVKAVGDTSIGKHAKQATQSVQDKIEDAREFWETSQNPIVYSLSSMWDSITGETEEGMTIAQIRKLDPKFVKEEWAEEVKTNLVPKLLRAHFLGDTRALKPLCGEAVYNKLAADAKARKKAGHVFDANLLSVEENQLILKLVEDMGPVIVGVYMVQQINCIRNKDGEIIEGAENDIRAKFYSLAFRQEFIEAERAVSWRAVEFMFVGDIPYI